MMPRLFGAAFAVVLASAGSAAADGGVGGEGSLNAGATTGNTQTADVGLGFKLNIDAGDWRSAVEASFDYAEKDRKESKNRTFAAYQLDRAFDNHVFSFMRASYEEDEFSGFESRGFIGAGLGYDVLHGENTAWAVQVAPGVKFDDVRPAPATDTREAIIGGEEQSVGVTLGSKFKHAFNPAVSISNDSQVIYAAVSTQTSNRLALTAKLTERISGRVSLEARYETDPPADREDTDTATRFGVVYEF